MAKTTVNTSLVQSAFNLGAVDVTTRKNDRGVVTSQTYKAHKAGHFGYVPKGDKEKNSEAKAMCLAEKIETSAAIASGAKTLLELEAAGKIRFTAASIGARGNGAIRWEMVKERVITSKMTDAQIVAYLQQHPELLKNITPASK